MPAVKSKPNRLSQEVAGILCAGAALLVLLALISYDHRDLPYFATDPNPQPSNFIGPVGAHGSLALFFVFGMAAYAVPFLLTWAAALLFLRPETRWLRTAGWMAAWLVSSACLLHLQPWGKEWASSVNTVGSGGYVGQLTSDYFLTALLGGVGSGIVLGLVWVVSSVFLFELHQRAAWLDFCTGLWHSWKNRRQEERLSRADPLERLAAEERKLQQQLRALEEQMAIQGLGSESAPKGRVRKPRVIDGARAEVPAVVEEEVSSREEAAVPTPAMAEELMEAPAAEASMSIAEEAPPVSEAVTAEQGAPVESAVAAPVARRPRTRKPKASALASEEGSLPGYEDYQLPPLDLLTPHDPSAMPVFDEALLQANAHLIVTTLAQFGIEAAAGDITRGATITRYEVLPAQGVRVDKIRGLQRDLARVLKAEKINILAPIPGKDSVGIEIPNSDKVPVVLRDLLEAAEWTGNRQKIPISVGKDVYGKALVPDLAEMPHLLIAGTTGSGKSVSINCLLLSLLYRFSPRDLRLILVDPKQVELQAYNTLPHLVLPVVTDPKKVLHALRWAIREMEERYRILAKVGVRNIYSFNSRPKQKQLSLLDALPPENACETEDGETSSVQEIPAERARREAVEQEPPIPDRLPYVVIVIDELADLMQTAPADVEMAIARLTAKARAAGIHLVVATQTPRREVITGVIKTNIPSRVAFQVPSALDSRVILDENGAENLLGKGDLLFMPPGSAKLVRGQGAFVSDDEVKRVVDFCAAQGTATFDQELHRRVQGGGGDDELAAEDQELVDKCLEIIRQEKRASTSLLQRRLRIGYNRAAWVMDVLERRGIVGPENGAKPREILVDPESLAVETETAEE